MRLAATRVQFACDWRPLRYKTREMQTRKCAGTMDDIATWKQILQGLSGNCMQSRQFFASKRQEQLQYLNKKNEDASKESTRHMSLMSAIINTMHGPIQSHKTVPLTLTVFIKQ
jgi:hypothetical protein